MEEMMQKSATTMLAVLALAAGMAIAQADEDYGPLKVQKTSMGNVLADPKGMTLYTFDKDTPGKSACNGQCATNWPPALVADNAKGAGDWPIPGRDAGL